MAETPADEEPGSYLRRTCLRDFAEPVDRRGPDNAKTYLRVLTPDAVPVPRLLRAALELIGIPSYGPGEKVEWWVPFTFEGELCGLAHEKFGLRLRVTTNMLETEAHALLARAERKLTAATRTVERSIQRVAPVLLATGNATVVNQHRNLRRAYEYFRERATSPTLIEDEYTEYADDDGVVRSSSFRSGSLQMQLNSFHDLIAAISAYLSMLEHDLVLAYALTGFDPATDSLTELIGAWWREKFALVVGDKPGGEALRQRLSDVVERWRNPYSHGGFEKGHGATIHIHVPGVGAVPVGLTQVRHSPMFSFMPASDTDIKTVFDLFDELDEWLRDTLPDATEWIESSLPVPFDEKFRTSAAEAQATGTFKAFLDYHGYRYDQAQNMDY